MNEYWKIIYLHRGIEEEKTFTSSGVLDAIQMFAETGASIGSIKKIVRI